MKRLLMVYALLSLAVLHSCYREEIIFTPTINEKLELSSFLSFDNKDCACDFAGLTLRYPVSRETMDAFSPYVEFQNCARLYFEGRELNNHAVNELGAVSIKQDYEIRIEVGNENMIFHLSFTTLPVVQLITPNEIHDEPGTLARIVVNYPEAAVLPDAYYISLEYRGGTSQSYEKKSFGFSLRGELGLDTKISGSFFGLESNNDWILDAMYIDRGRLRNKTSFELWQEINGSWHKGIPSRFVELYMNDEVRGLYCLNCNLNAELLQLEGNGAALYKATGWGDGVPGFSNYLPPTTTSCWSGWEQRYPDPSDGICWGPLDSLTRFVVLGEDEAFKEEIGTRIDMDSFIDYLLFLNLISAMDNTSKNTWLVREDSNLPFYILPWDLDGTWGVFWDGSYVDWYASLSNGLYDRLKELNPESYNKRLRKRWESLREGPFTEDSLYILFHGNFDMLRSSDIMDIENKTWGLDISIDEEEDYLMDWMEHRLRVLDERYSDD